MMEMKVGPGGRLVVVVAVFLLGLEIVVMSLSAMMKIRVGRIMSNKPPAIVAEHTNGALSLSLSVTHTIICMV